MAELSLPSSPSDGDTVTHEGTKFTYVLAKDRWDRTLTNARIENVVPSANLSVTATGITGNTLVFTQADGSTANVDLSALSGGQVTSYATESDLPSDADNGSHGYVTATSFLYVKATSGWYKITSVNLTPAVTISSNNVTMSGAAETFDVTYTVAEPEDTPVTITVSNTGISNTDQVSVTHHTGNNTISLLSGTAALSGGTITISASDGINVGTGTISIDVTQAITYSLNSDTPKSFTSSPSMASLLDGPDNYDDNIDINYDGTAIVTGTGASNPIPGNSGYNNAGALAHIVKQSGTWVRTVSTQNINYYTSPGNARLGTYGVTISPNGKRSAAATYQRLSSGGNGPTLARPIHNWDSLSITDGTAYSPAYNQTQLNVPNGPGGSHNSGQQIYMRSPFVGVVGNRYSYSLWAMPYIKNTSSTFTSQGCLKVIRNDEQSTNSNGVDDISTISNTISNHNAGQKGGAINHQGDRMVYATGSNRFDYYKATGTAGYVTTGVSTNSLSSIGGISTSALAPAGHAFRFDSNYNLYVHGGSQIAVFDLTNGTSSDLNSYTTINLSTLVSTSPTTGAAVTWSNNIDGFSVSYDGTYMVTINGSNGYMYIFDNLTGTWALSQEIVPPAGVWESCAMSGDKSTIAARTSTNAVYIYEG